MVHKILHTKLRFFWLVLCLTVCMSNIALSGTIDPAGDFPSISRMEVRTTSTGEEVIITGDKPFKHSAFMLTDPDRLVVDIPNAKLTISEPEVDGNYSFLSSVTSRKIVEGKKELVRVELSLLQQAPYQITSKGNQLSIIFGDLATQSVKEAADARSMTSTLPETDSLVSEGAQGSGDATSGSDTTGTFTTQEASKVYGLTPAIKYKGKPIFLDLKDADILDIFRLIAEVSGFNVVVDPDVGGRLTIRMDNVPWDQALEVILKNQGLGKEIEGNVMRIARNEKLRDENILRQQLEYHKRHALALETLIVYLSYADIDDMLGTLKGVLSDRGFIMRDQRVNALIVRDIPANLEKVSALVKILDVRTLQVALNSQIVVTKKDFTRDLGIAWGGRFVADATHGNTTKYRFPNNYGIDFSQNSYGGKAPGWTATDGSGYAVNLPAGNTLLALSFGNVMDTLKLNLALSAAETEGLTKTIAHPRVTTVNHESASVTSGIQIPYPVDKGEGGISIEFREASTNLNVTPHITNDNWIKLMVTIARNFPGPTYSGAGASIFTNSANSTVLIRDGETLVIGGMNESIFSNSTASLPWLSKIPVLGWLFKNDTRQTTFSDLLFFVTPQILNEGEQNVRSETF